MRKVAVLAVLLIPGAVFAQGTSGPDLGYTYAELRYVDTDQGGGEGLLFGGSYDLGNNWIILGGLTSLDYNGNVDETVIEVGGGYIFDLNQKFDIVTSVTLLDVDFDTTGGGGSDSGIGLSAGVRGLLTPEVEVRGSVHHVNLDNSDTYLELGGDYHFSRQFAAGVSLQMAGDNDLFTIGARWFFR
jgi:hypothetical protein